MMNKALLLIASLLAASASAFLAPATKAFRPTTTTTTTTTVFSSAPATTTAAGSSFAEYTQTSDQGLEYQDTLMGTGDVAEKGKVLTVAYTARLMATGKQFDQGNGYSFKLGDGRVLPGWEKGLQGMKVGGKRTLRIPPSLAYQDRGAKDVIPPNAHLEYDCELISIASNPISEALAQINMSPLRIFGLLFFLGLLSITPMLPQ